MLMKLMLTTNVTVSKMVKCQILFILQPFLEYSDFDMSADENEECLPLNKDSSLLDILADNLITDCSDPSDYEDDNDASSVGKRVEVEMISDTPDVTQEQSFGTDNKEATKCEDEDLKPKQSVGG